MIVVARIDKTTGLFLEDVVLDDGQTLPEDCVQIRPTSGMYQPKWDGTAWIEGKSQAEVDAALMNESTKRRAGEMAIQVIRTSKNPEIQALAKLLGIT